jgi:hypothetical protein
VYAWLTGLLMLETRRLRRAGTEPDVVAYLLPDPRHLNLLHLIVANVGQGPAHNVAIEIDADASEFAAKGLRIPVAKRLPILSLLPQNERMHQLFGNALDLLTDPPLDLLTDPPLKDFTIRVHFESIKGDARTKCHRASVIDFKGLTRAGEPPEYQAAEALKKIAQVVDHWSSGFRRLKVQTLTALEEEQQLRAAREPNSEK